MDDDRPGFRRRRHQYRARLDLRDLRLVLFRRGRDGTRLTREIFDQPAFDPYRGDEINPGPEVRSNDEIDDWVRRNVETAYHPAGTCRMGKDDMAVVDPECRVRGIEALRVIDSSIMPTLTNGNINAPTLMIGEKGADHVLGRTPLDPSTADVYVAPDWEHTQRTGTPERASEWAPKVEQAQE